MITSLRMWFVLGAMATGVMLTTPTRAADPRSGARGNNQAQAQAQPVSRQDAFAGQTQSRQDAFFGQLQSRQDAFFSQSVFPQQPFNQNATILPPVFFAPMQLNYQGVPSGIISGTGASVNPVLINTSRGVQSGVATPSAITNVDVGASSPTFVSPMITLSVSQRVESSTNRQTFTQIMPRQGLLGRW